MMFRDQVGVLASWFKGWNECEQTVALLSLLKRVSRTQARFLQLCLEHSLAECTELQVLEGEANNPGRRARFADEADMTEMHLHADIDIKSFLMISLGYSYSSLIKDPNFEILSLYKCFTTYLWELAAVVPPPLVLSQCCQCCKDQLKNNLHQQKECVANYLKGKNLLE